MSGRSVLAVIDVPEMKHELATKRARIQESSLESARRQLTTNRRTGASERLGERPDQLARTGFISDRTLDQVHAMRDPKADLGLRGRTATSLQPVDVAAPTVEKVKALLAYTRSCAFDGVVARRR